MADLRVLAIVQARMTSTRLPGKVLAPIAGRPMLWHVVQRARRARLVDEVVIATSDQPTDDGIADFAVEHRFPIFRGSADDVLDRYYQATRNYPADVIVRITADCPLLDPEVVDRVIQKYLEGDFDLVSSCLRPTYPDGLDVTAFSLDALEQAWRGAQLPAEREHVVPYIIDSGLFRLGSIENEINLSGLRWTVDEERDLDFVRAVYDRLRSCNEGVFGMGEVLKLLDEQPELLALNGDIIRNEGYYKSLAAEPPVQPLARRLIRSTELKARAERLIPSCSQTFSKSPSQFVQGVAPVFLQRAQGSHVWDVDGNEYIDYPMALGPIILGHNYPAVSEAVIRQIREGTSFSLPHPLEIEVSEMLVDLIPCAEMVRFGKNGSDATAGAVRAARAYTGRDVIACCGYHGWQDWYIGTTTRHKGVPSGVAQLAVPFEYNDIASLERVFAAYPGQVAAVIMEPVGVVEPNGDFLQRVRELTRRDGAFLIFDEVITGFRLAQGGAQQYFGVVPDLACFGKAIANGYPLSAVVGPREIMQIFDEVFFSFTFGGETVSLAAALATLREIRDRNVIGYLWARGEELKDGYNVLAREFGLSRYTECVGLPPRTVVAFKDESGEESLVLKSLFQQEVLKRGVLFLGVHFLCYSHSTTDINRTLRVYRTALELLKAAIERGDAVQRLEGPPVSPVFRHA